MNYIRMNLFLKRLQVTYIATATFIVCTTMVVFDELMIYWAGVVK